MNFSSKQTIESTTHPGVRFVVRNLNVIQRAKRDAKLIDVNARIDTLLAKLKALTGEDKKPLSGKESEYRAVDSQLSMIVAGEKYPAILRAGLLSIEGYEVDGSAPTADALIEHCEDDLLTEIVAACLVASGLTAVQEKNSPSPGTSPAPEGGPATPTTATAAGE